MKIAIIIVVVALLGGGFWYYTTQMQKSGSSQTEGTKDADDTKSKDVVLVDKNKTEIFKLKDKVQVNIFDEKRTPYIVIAKMSFEVSNKKAADELEKQEAKVADIVNTILSSKTYEDITLNDKDRSQLKNDLKTKVDALLTEGRCVGVLFESFVYQSLH